MLQTAVHKKNDSIIWPKLIDLSPAECQLKLRRLELEAYGKILSVFRAQGPLTEEKRIILKELQKMLRIAIDRHKAEVRRVTYDEELSTISESISGQEIDDDWVIEGQRLAPILDRPTVCMSSLSQADNVSKESRMKNVLLDKPAFTANYRAYEKALIQNISKESLSHSQFIKSHKRDFKRMSAGDGEDKVEVQNKISNDHPNVQEPKILASPQNESDLTGLNNRLSKPVIHSVSSSAISNVPKCLPNNDKNKSGFLIPSGKSLVTSHNSNASCAAAVTASHVRGSTDPSVIYVNNSYAPVSPSISSVKSSSCLNLSVAKSVPSQTRNVIQTPSCHKVVLQPSVKNSITHVQSLKNLNYTQFNNSKLTSVVLPSKTAQSGHIQAKGTFQNDTLPQNNLQSLTSIRFSQKPLQQHTSQSRLPNVKHSYVNSQKESMASSIGNVNDITKMLNQKNVAIYPAVSSAPSVQSSGNVILVHRDAGTNELKMSQSLINLQSVPQTSRISTSNSLFFCQPNTVMASVSPVSLGNAKQMRFVGIDNTPQNSTRTSPMQAQVIAKSPHKAMYIPTSASDQLVKKLPLPMPNIITLPDSADKFAEASKKTIPTISLPLTPSYKVSHVELPIVNDDVDLDAMDDEEDDRNTSIIDIAAANLNLLPSVSDANVVHARPTEQWPIDNGLVDVNHSVNSTNIDLGPDAKRIKFSINPPNDATT